MLSKRPTFPWWMHLTIVVTGVTILALAGTAGAQKETSGATKPVKADLKSASMVKDMPAAPYVEGKAEIGKSAPDFVLVDTDGKPHRLSNYKGKTVVLEWFNPDCPFVKKHHQKNKSMAASFTSAKEMDVIWLAINSGAPGKQGNGLERNQKARAEYGIEYPVLLDETGIVGHAFGAKTTPHMFIIEGDRTLVYAGSLDDNKSPDKVGETNYVLDALDQCASGKPVEVGLTKSYGCSVKYGS